MVADTQSGVVPDVGSDSGSVSLLVGDLSRINQLLSIPCR